MSGFIDAAFCQQTKQRMVAGNIDFQVEYPAGYPKQFSPAGDDDFVHVRNQNRPPLVIILGWIGSQNKNLSRYCDIYQKRGCLTVRFCVPPKDLMFNHHKYPQMARQLLDSVCEANLDKHPIIFHVFSNGGCYIYQYLVNEVKNRSQKLDVIGCVMDSAPGKMRMTSVFKTIMTLPIKFTPLRIIFALFACFWMYVTHCLMLFLQKFVNPLHLGADVSGNLSSAPINVPSLFFYSYDDKFVQYQDIEDFIDMRRRQGCHVRTCPFTSSSHVAHLREHKKEYEEHLNEFVDFCLENRSSETFGNFE